MVSVQGQPVEYNGAPLYLHGELDQQTVDQMKRCMSVGNVVAGAICADGHLGYSQPVGGVIAYEGQISVSGVGFDIGCGNMAMRLNLPYREIRDKVPEIARLLRERVSFGVGRVNDTRVEHELFDYDELWRNSGMNHYKEKALVRFCLLPGEG